MREEKEIDSRTNCQASIYIGILAEAIILDHKLPEETHAPSTII